MTPPPATTNGAAPDGYDEISFRWKDALQSNESRWKPKEVPLDDGRTIILEPEAG